MLWLLEPGKFKVKAATISHHLHCDRWWLSVTSEFHGRSGDYYGSEVAAKRDFGRKWGKGAKWKREKDVA